MEILRLLDGSPCVEIYEVIEFRQWENGIYYRIRVKFSDASILHLREYIDESSRNYSFHWEDAEGSLLVRWDNAPHHKNLLTFPHHKHKGDDIQESHEIQAIEVLRVIGELIAQ